MLIFVKSAGGLRKFDYVWVGQDTQEQLSEKLPETSIKQRVPKEVWDLVSTDERSWLFFQSHESSCLLVTKIASKRQDFAQRRISSAVGFFSEELEERIKLRKFFTSFLFNPAEIQDKIDDLILGSNDEPGFKFSEYQLEELINQDLDIQMPDVQADLEVGYVLPDLPSSYREIAEQMLVIDEKKVGPIFLFREYEDDKFFQEKKVWRGISKLVSKKTEAYAMCPSSFDSLPMVGPTGESVSNGQWVKTYKDAKKRSEELISPSIIKPVAGPIEFVLWQFLEKIESQNARCFLEEAAKTGVKKAMIKLAFTFENEGKNVEAIKWFKLAKKLYPETRIQIEDRCKALEANISDDEKRQVEEFVKNELSKKGVGVDYSV